MLKRLLDVVASSIGLIVLLPVMLIIALAVRFGSAGPALFKQTRVGKSGKPFTLYKFRTMADAPRGDSPQLVTRRGDPRITAVGAFLRRSKLDELPQLFNVLCGDMSLVGPRPEVPRYVAMYPAEIAAIVLSVRPGITDEASIEFRDEELILDAAGDVEASYVRDILPRKLDLYVRYAQNRSFLGDLSILLRTLHRLVLR